MGNNNDHVTEIVSEVDDFFSAFLKQLTESARSAAKRKTVLLVAVFAPVTPDHDICVNFGGTKKYLTVERLRQTIQTAVGNTYPVILVTPSAFTGGWLCRPWFMSLPGSSSAETMMRIIAKSCGAAFAERLVRSFTQKGTPLLTDVQRQKVKYDDPMPTGPTNSQIDLLHRFQRQIHESLKQRLLGLARQHSFVLDQDAAQDPSTYVDAWTTFAPRRGRPMTFWAERCRNSRPVVENADRYEFLGEAFGGTRVSQLFHLRYLAEIELDTCPGDWTKGAYATTHEMLKAISEISAPAENRIKHVLDVLEFRASSMVLAQIVAKAFGLPTPDIDMKCRYWEDSAEDTPYYAKLQYAFGVARDLFCQVPVHPGESRHNFKYPHFWRAARWLSAEVALRFSRDHSRGEVEGFVSKHVARFFSKIEETQKALLLEDKAVTRAGLNWLVALGLAEENDPDIAMGKVSGSALGQSKNLGTSVSAKSSAITVAEISTEEMDLISQSSKTVVSQIKPAMETAVHQSVKSVSGPTRSDDRGTVVDYLDDFGARPTMPGSGSDRGQNVMGTHGPNSGEGGRTAEDKTEDLLQFENEKANEPVKAAAAAPAVSREQIATLVSTVLGGNQAGIQNLSTAQLSQLFKKASEVLAQEAQAKNDNLAGPHKVLPTTRNSSGHQAMATPVDNTWDSVQSTRTPSLTVPKNPALAEVRAFNNSGNGTAPADQGSLTARAQSMNLNQPTPPRTPAPQNQFMAREPSSRVRAAPAGGQTGLGVAAAGNAQRPVGQGNNAIIEGEDFWANAGIDW